EQQVITEDIIRLVEPINILDTEAYEEELRKISGPGAKAEKIDAATSKYITVNIDTNTVLYHILCEVMSETIAEMRANRLSELEALKSIREIKEQVLKGGGDTVPEELQGKRRNIGIYHLFQSEELLNGKEVDAALMFDEILSSCEIV